MDARLLFLLLAAAASAPLASAQLAPGFYKTSCPDAEKIIFSVVERRFKQDPGTASGLLRLVFHDCFANGCDASILIDPLSNQASEKEAGPNVSVKGYDVIEEAKAELEKQCPNVVSCADVVAVGARDGVRLTGGPAYEVPTGRRDSLVSNREDADNLPGPDIAVPKLIDEFAAKGFSAEEMVAMIAGGHTIGTCRCLFIETDAAPIDPEYKKNISAACDGKDTAAVPMDAITPNVFDGNYFGLALAKKMPLTVDRLIGLDPRTEPIIKANLPKPDSFVPLFAKSMEKLSVLKVLTGKDGEIRRSCSEFNNPQPTDGPSVIRISSFNPSQMDGVSQPGAKPGAAEARKVGGRAELRKEAVPGDAGIKRVPNGREVGKAGWRNEAGGLDANNAAMEDQQDVSSQAAGLATNSAEANKARTVAASAIQADGNKVLGDEPASKLPGGGEIKKDVASQAAGQVAGTAQINKAVGTEASTSATGGIQADGSKVLGDEPASKEAAKVFGEEKIKARHPAKLRQAGNQVPGGEEAGKAAAIKALKRRNSKKLRGGHEAANQEPGGEEAAKVAAEEEIKKRNAPKLRGGHH